VAQDAWLGFLEGVDRFEGRASIRTWLCTIVANKARSRAVRDARSVPFADVDEPASPAVDPGRFLPDDHPRWPGHWSAAPVPFSARPDGALLAGETQGVMLRAIDALPERQRAVILLHDVHGATPAEICAVLGISEGNRRVLLHRARTAVRAALEVYLDETVAA
jgi:RNA polymerase sigma-70 factor (ECF subfamily)